MIVLLLKFTALEFEQHSMIENIEKAHRMKGDEIQRRATKRIN